MSITKCRECAHPVSRRADHCPGCGAPIRKRTSGFTWLVAIVFGGYCIAVLPGTFRTDVKKRRNTADSVASPKPTKIAVIDKSEKVQMERKKIIEDLIREGIFQKIEMPGSLPRVWVRPSFYLLEFDRKEKILNIIYAYFFDGTRGSDCIKLIDSLSGKDVGLYSLNQYPALELEAQ